MRELYLGLDVGTQGTKGLVLDAATGEVVARASHGYGLLEGLGPHDAEQDPETWIDAVARVARALHGAGTFEAREVRGVAVSGQQHGLVVLDAADRVVRPAKLWCDTSTAEEAAELSRALGRRVPAGFTAPKILWLARHEPERWARVRRVLLPHDFVNLRLTGVASMEAGDASGTGFFDPVSRTFDRAAAERVDPRLPALLPPLTPPGAPAGRLTASGAALLGLSEGVLVAAGGGDNMMSAIGSGATREGVTVVSLGTSGTAFAHSARPVIDPEGAIAAFCGSTGGWLPLLCVMNMTGVANEIVAAFPGSDHTSLTEAARAVPPGADGLVLLPYLAGERVPDLPLATGVLAGLRPGLLRAGHLYRAALEGTVASLALGVLRMRRLGVAVDRVRLAGGGAKNALWPELVADLLEVPVERLVEPESAALGAAIQALWTARRAAGREDAVDLLASRVVRTEPGELAPHPERRATYAELRGRVEALTARIYADGRAATGA